MGASAYGAPVLLLHHTGAKSGKERISPLLYMPDGDRMVVVASKGGYTKHPGWFHNLKANPETMVQVGSSRRGVRARTATAAERKRLWPKIVKHYSGFGDYQKRTEREIPLVILERV